MSATMPFQGDKLEFEKRAKIFRVGEMICRVFYTETFAESPLLEAKRTPKCPIACRRERRFMAGYRPMCCARWGRCGGLAQLDPERTLNGFKSEWSRTEEKPSVADSRDSTGDGFP